MKNIIVLIALLNCSGIFSQDLSIQLEIEKVRKKNVLNIGSLRSKRNIEVPYLKVTYTNLSDKDVYFKKINRSQKTKYHPKVLTHQIFKNFNNDLDSNLKKDTSSVYTVFLDSQPLSSGFLFEIENEKTIRAYGKQYVTVYPLREMVESRFYTIMDIIELQNMLNEYHQDVQLEYFKYNDKKDISIREAEKWLHHNDHIKNIDKAFTDETLSIDVSLIRDDFIFLKGGESYTEKISLIGLKLLGQNFEFDFRELKFHDYEERFDFDTKKFLHFYYPKNVDGYAPLNEHSVIDFTSLKVKL